MTRQYDQARKDFKKALELKPDSAWAYNNLGWVYHDNGMQLDMAISYFNKALELDQKYVDAYIGRADSLFYAGCYVEAVEDYSKIIEINPEAENAYANRGKVYNVMGKSDLAFSDFAKAIEINPENPYPFELRGLTLMELGRYLEAAKDYRTAKQLRQKMKIVNERYFIPIA